MSPEDQLQHIRNELAGLKQTLQAALHASPGDTQLVSKTATAKAMHLLGYIQTMEHANTIAPATAQQLRSFLLVFDEPGSR